MTGPGDVRTDVIDGYHTGTVNLYQTGREAFPVIASGIEWDRVYPLAGEFTNDFTTFHLLQMLTGDLLIVTGLFTHGVDAVQRAAAG